MANYLCLLVIMAIKMFKIDAAVDNVQGIRELIVQETEIAKLKWNFLFPMSDVYSVSIRHFKVNDDNPNGPALLGVRNGRLVEGQNPQFSNRITGSFPSGSVGISLDILRVTIFDQGRYECIVEMNQFGISYKNTTNLIVKVPPNIDKTFKSLSKTEGEFANLQCITVEGNPKPMVFKWFKENENGQEIQLVSSSQWDRYDYNISSVGRDSRGKYKCQVENIGGVDYHWIQLDVRYTPVVVYPPINRTVFQDRGTVEFNCQADGNPPEVTYHWFIDQPIGSNEIKQNTDVIRIENSGQRLKFVKPSLRDGTYYFCAGSNTLGTGLAKGAFLNVTYIPGAIFIPELRNNIFNGNERTNFSVQCQSDANPPAAFTWSRRTKDWKGDYVYAPIVIDSYSGKLNFYNATTNDTGTYRCVAQNTPDLNNLEQKYAAQIDIEVIVRYGPRQTNLTINGMLYTEVEIPQNDMAEIRCETFSEPNANYEIQLDKRGPVQLNSNSEVGYYKIEQMSVADEGIYKCIASNPILKTVEVRELRVHLSIRPEPWPPIPSNNIETTEGATISMQCYAQGRPAPKVYWQKYGANITYDSVITSIYNNKVYEDSLKIRVSSSLTFAGIRHTDNGGYSCIMYNSAGNINTTTTYKVLYKPKITARPENASVRADRPTLVRFVCDAVGNPNVVSWRWYFNDVLTTVTTNEFVRAIPKAEDNGKYVCESRNEQGVGETATAYLHVEYKPEITFISPNQILNVSTNVQLGCQARGVPEPVISWTNSLNNKFSSIGERLIMTDVTSQQMGEYSCSATNRIGVDTRSLKVFIRHAPIITTTSPAETKRGVSVGDTAVLICGVAAYPPPTIQWMIPGSTTMLTDGLNGFSIIESAQEFGSSSRLSVIVAESHLGKEYTCKAMNSFGEATQRFQILSKGKPEPPVSLTATDVLVPTVPVTVNITLEWIPGFDGGYPVDFVILYRINKEEFSFREYRISQTIGNKYTLDKMQAGKEYIFSMKASNERGISTEMQYISFTSKEAPPDVAKVSMTRIGNDGTSILISWEITREPDQAQRKRRAVGEKTIIKWDYGIVRYRKVDVETFWTEEKILSIKKNDTYQVDRLDANQEYEFQFVLYDTSGKFGKPVLIGKLFPGVNPTISEVSGLSKTDIIALIVGCGGAVLLLIVIIISIVVCRKKEKSNYKTHYNNGRVKVDIPVSTMQSNHSRDIVRQSYLNDDDPFAVDSSILEDDDKSPPPDYNSTVHYLPPMESDRDHRDHPQPVSTFHPDSKATPSYTSFGRLPKKTSQDSSYSRSMTSLSQQRATEISRRSDYRHSMDALDEQNNRRQKEPLLSGDNEKQPRHSRDRLLSDDEVPEPPFPLRSQPSDDGGINNRVPGAFDRTGKYKRPSPRSQEEKSNLPAPTPGFHLNTGRSSPQSSVASSKPYKSDNEYIDDADDNYVGFLV